MIVSTLKKWPRFLRNLSRTLNCAAGPRSQNGKMNCNEVYQYSNTMLLFFLPLYCVLKIEAFVVALIWSPGRNCATDWILKYTPLRVLQTMDTNRKRLKLEQQCLTLDYQCDV